MELTTEEGRGARQQLQLLKRIESTKPLAKSAFNGDDGSAQEKLMVFFKLFLACSVCGGIHYGWGLQISVLTPYAQVFGIPHMYASLICSSGPMVGILVNPILSCYSNRCTMRMGRRRPFILVGCFIICISVILIGFSSDIGHHLGDPKEQCGAYTGLRKGSSAILILGFWLLDFSNNAIQDLTRAMMADLSAESKLAPLIGQAIYSMWGGIGAILGYAAGATDEWPQWFPWLKTEACCGACVNIKGAFFTSVVLIVVSMTITMIFANEHPIDKKDVDTTQHAFTNSFKCMKNMSPSTTRLFIMTGFSWLALYPFFVYSTDWIGREIYHGNPQGTAKEVQMYINGVRKGCIGLILCSFFRTTTTFLVPKLCQKLTKKVVWSLSNFALFLLMSTTVIISVISTRDGLLEPDPTLRVLAISIFALIGITTAVTLSLPVFYVFQIVAEEGDSQGRTISAITIAVVMPQLITVLTTGPIDTAFNNGGNTPGFVLSAALAFICWVLGLLLIS